MRFHTRQRRLPGINIVPLIDILTLMLIFFLITTTFKRAQPAVQIDLSESEHGVAADTSLPVIINVARDNAVFLDAKPVKVEELAGALKGILDSKPESKFALNADRVADFGVIVKVLDAFKDAGIKDVPAFTETPSKEK
mgnify:CR=1 FL=1